MKGIKTASALLCTALMLGCGSSSQTIPEPDLAKARELANLATTELYFHTVGSYLEEKGVAGMPITGWGAKDYNFWTEFNLVVPMSIDAGEMEMEVDGQNVTIWLPEPKIGDPRIMTIKEAQDLDQQASEDLSITFKDGNSITDYLAPGSASPTDAQHNQVETEAVEKVQQLIAENPEMLNLVKENTKDVLRGYVESIGLGLGRDKKYYQVTFKDLADKK